MRQRLRDVDRGFTLVEVLTAIAIGGILMALGVLGLRHYQAAKDESGTALAVQSTLRNVAERALSEGRTYCVQFTPSTSTTRGSWKVYRYSCSASGTQVDGTSTTPSVNVQIALTTPFAAIAGQVNTCPTTGTCAYFYPRGNASAGAVAVTRSGASATYTVSIEGLTGRVTTSPTPG